MDKYNCKWVMLFNPDKKTDYAITLGQTTYYSCDKTKVTVDWRAHEDCHKKQFKKYTVVGFLVLYAYHYLRLRIVHRMNHRAAYMMIPFEVEARVAERLALMQSYGVV